jgi:hypothetical protein
LSWIVAPVHAGDRSAGGEGGVILNHYCLHAVCCSASRSSITDAFHVCATNVGQLDMCLLSSLPQGRLEAAVMEAMKRHVATWDVRDVCNWVEVIGFPQYRRKFAHNRCVHACAQALLVSWSAADTTCSRASKHVSCHRDSYTCTFSQVHQ